MIDRVEQLARRAEHQLLEGVGSEAEVHDLGTLGHRPVDGGGDVVGVAVAVAVEALGDDEPYGGSDTADALPVVAVGGDDARDVGAVTMVVLAAGMARAAHTVGRRPDTTHEVFVIARHTRVDHADGDAGA